MATLSASERFHTNAQQLATLAVFQLVVYAGMQIPVGVLLDRFGPKKLMVTGALVMASGSLTVAFAPSLAFAVLGRMLVGMGDSFTFISMIRMINGWYETSRASRVQQYVATFGQLGQFLSAVPFWFLLEHFGWNWSFTVISLVSLAVVLLLIALTADENPSGIHVHERPISLQAAFDQLVENIREPGIRMAFWTHFVTQPTTTAVGLLWGIPFLVSAEGQSHEFASLTLTLMVFLGFITGPIIGYICSKHPNRRPLIVHTVVASTCLTWVLIIAWPQPLPPAVLVTAFLIISIGGPASMIAFDFTKDIANRARLGSANGFANVGGFLASFVMMYLTGLVIDLVQGFTGSEQRFTLDGFRLGFSAQLVVVGIGMLLFETERRKFRKNLELRE